MGSIDQNRQTAARHAMPDYLISLFSSLNSGVPARPSHLNGTISVVATSTPFSRSRCKAMSRLAGAREEMASTTTTI